MSSKKLRVSSCLTLLFIVALPLIYTCNNDNVCPPSTSNDTDCEMVPANLDFGNVVVGTHLDKSFAIVNNSGDTLTGNVGESCDDYYIISGEGPFSLLSHDIWPVTVRFEPISNGLKECTINTGTALCSDVSCAGTAELLPDCHLTPTSLDFGYISSGDYNDMAFTIKNNGGGTVAGSVSESCSHYSIATGDGPYNLGAGDSVIVTVRFEPTSSGTKTCIIETGAAICSDVQCEGRATAPDPGIPDTVRVESLDLPVGIVEFDLRVYLHNDEDLASISIPLAWDSPDITCEAVDFSGSRVDYLNTKVWSIDNPNHQVLVGAIVFFEPYIQPGSGLVFTLHFSVDPMAAQQMIIFDKTFVPPGGIPALTSSTGINFVPQFVPGTINLGNARIGAFPFE
jgi:hypothetical protein